MAIPEDHITAQLLNQVEGDSNREKWESLSKDYPWYPLPWLMLAQTDEDKQKAALWFKNEHRIHWLLNSPATAQYSEPVLPSASEFEKELLAEDGIEIDPVNLSKEIERHTPEFVEDQDDLVKSNLSIQPTEIIVPDIKDEEVLDIALDEEEIKEELEWHTEVEIEEKTGSFEPVAEEPVENLGTASEPEVPVKIETTVARQSGVNTMEEKPAEEKLLFEPLYTTDYFASQGIKLDQNAIPKTKLDQQVKTFTQWLKTMKRVGPEVSSTADPMVDAQASASVQEKDVITEAMVAVLEKQGKYQKAIDTLGKLILLHPEKSAFFAAQIENLKAKQ